MATAPMSGGPYLCAGILIRMRGMHIIVIARVIAASDEVRGLDSY